MFPKQKFQLLIAASPLFLHPLNNASPSHLTFIKGVEEGGVVILQYIPSYFGVPGNEAVDKLPKRGYSVCLATFQAIIYVPIASVISCMIRDLHFLKLGKRASE